jgi:hypothetical protein
VTSQRNDPGAAAIAALEMLEARPQASLAVVRAVTRPMARSHEAQRIARGTAVGYPTGANALSAAGTGDADRRVG